ncbi:glycerol transporter [Puccinia graminis f. sp. tritici]|uniref:Glycerol transporter n=1 Tax=Puccinia graminis f. sp. tritici TaxID=56615 RepID=A0A5B0Q5R2_PUCGR|nr:glycerol transporter [Puccinia graminis f. sp. tritici]
MQDNSDLQYRRFRQGLTKLGLLSLGYLSVSKLSRRWLGPGRRKDFQTLIAALILLLLHGSSVIIIFAILILNFQVSRISIPTSPSSRIQKAAATGLVWFVNLAVLFANDYWNGYAFKHLSSSLEFLDRPQYKGLIPRWQIGFNISLLRLISYALDYQWAVQNHFQNLPRSSAAGEPENEKERAKSNRVSADYGFQNYFNYVLYPPLYIAGPIITFNNFMSQMNKKPSTITRRTIAGYTARFGVCYLTLEWILHYMYVVAIKDTQGWAGDTPFELGIIGYWNLIIIWLKLLIPWRFFRLWALLDGVDPPENMIRCMSNNFSTLEFWRSWHRSYNLWIVRYLYIPLGGAANMVPATVVVFTFVALWHDLSFKLLTWGWLVSLFVLPEVIAKQTFAKSSYRSKDWFRHLVALGGTLNVMTMMSANLVGFSIGIDGVKFMWHELLGSWAGVRVLAAILAVVFCAVQVMIEYREAEMREGILRKC